MLIYKILHYNNIIEFKTLVDAEFYAMQNGLNLENIVTEERVSSLDVYSLVDNALIEKQNKSMHILRQIFVENTLAGISTEESKLLFQQHASLVIALMVGAFPTAYSMLNDIQPSGFLTQERLDRWKQILSENL